MMAVGLPLEVVLNVEADHNMLHGKRRALSKTQCMLSVKGWSFQGKFRIFNYLRHESFQVVSELRQMVGEIETVMIRNMTSLW